VLLKVFSAISSFLALWFAIIFGVELSPDKQSLFLSAATISIFVVGVSFVLGVVLGGRPRSAGVVSGCLALFILWLPQQFYSTHETLLQSGGIMLLLFFAIALFWKLGARSHSNFMAAYAKLVS
jgi:hypothetical protein